MLARQQILKVLYTVTSYTSALNFGIFLQLEDSRTLQDLVREAQALWFIHACVHALSCLLVHAI